MQHRVARWWWWLIKHHWYLHFILLLLLTSAYTDHKTIYMTNNIPPENLVTVFCVWHVKFFLYKKHDDGISLNVLDYHQRWRWPDRARWTVNELMNEWMTAVRWKVKLFHCVANRSWTTDEARCVICMQIEPVVCIEGNESSWISSLSVNHKVLILPFPATSLIECAVDFQWLEFE